MTSLLTFSLLYCIKQIDSMLPPIVCSVINHRRRQNVARTSVTHSLLCATFLLLPCFDVIADLLLNRLTATWNLFVNYINVKDHRLLTHVNQHEGLFGIRDMSRITSQFQ